MESFQEIYENDYDLITWKDSAIEDILKYAPKNSYTWKVYERLFINGQPEKNGLYYKSVPIAIQRMLNEEIIFMATDEQMFQTEEVKLCKIAKLKENLPVLPLSFPLTKGRTGKH